MKIKIKIKKDTTVSKITEHLRKEIMYGNLKPLEHLKENHIAKIFGVSRVPVRESLRILHSEGYLQMIPNRGSFVKKISMEYIMEITKMYVFIAPELLRDAIPRYKKSTYKKAYTAIEKVERCKDFNKVGYLLWDFAKVIYAPSKYKFMYFIMDEIYKHNIRILNEIFELSQHKNYDLSPHKRFLELCQENRNEEAIKEWENYVNKLASAMVKIKIPSK